MLMVLAYTSYKESTVYEVSKDLKHVSYFPAFLAVFKKKKKKKKTHGKGFTAGYTLHLVTCDIRSVQTCYDYSQYIMIMQMLQTDNTHVSAFLVALGQNHSHGIYHTPQAAVQKTYFLFFFFFFFFFCVPRLDLWASPV